MGGVETEGEEHMKVIEGSFGKQPPKDIVEQLEGLLEEAKAGRINSIVAAYTLDDEYTFMFGASLTDAIVMTTLLQAFNIHRMRAPA